MVVTTINLASSTGKKVHSTDEILRQIESTLPEVSEQNLAQRQGGLSARLQGRINEHELTYGDKALPRQRLPKVDNVLLDRYQAARHNVLVLGAIQQVEGKSKQGTNRSKAGGKGSHTPHAAGGSHTPARPGSSAGLGSLCPSEAGGASLLGPESSAGLVAGPSESDVFSSFKSRVSSKALGSIREDEDRDEPEEDAQGSGLVPEASHISSRAGGRRFNRQGSNSSIASRVSAASFASGATGASGISSAGQGRHHLRQQQSYISSGGSSGYTLRSGKTGSIAGSSWTGHHKKGGKRHKQPPTGRITRAFAEYGSKDDWVSKTLLKHTLAAIIQANWRGYWLRQHWKVNKEQVVLDEQARINAAALQQARLQDLQQKLLLYQQKKLAQAAAEAAAGGAGPGAPAVAAGLTAAAGAAAGSTVGATVSRTASAVMQRGELGTMASWHSLRSTGEASYQADAGSDSDSAWSDIELEDVAAIKFRAVTPPWQRGAERQQMSLQLQHRIAAAAAAFGAPAEPAAAQAAAIWGEGLKGLGSCWEDGEEDDTQSKLQELRRRRICRVAEPVPLSAPAFAAASTAGLLAAGTAAAAAAAAGDGEDAAAGAAAGPSGPAEAEAEAADPQGLQVASASAVLPPHVVDALLLERYNSKYTRLGVPHKMPGRQRWLRMQAEAAAAAAGGLEEGEDEQVAWDGGEVAQQGAAVGAAEAVSQAAGAGGAAAGVSGASAAAAAAAAGAVQ